ncbi:MAG: hypothetical protein V4514_16195 [Pseudomonadota bacterium]|uniref:hypothetical protein n=1 Tax=Phenylobacterium sp. TaxID=1871053 RepID=UPI0025D8173F|nr:hypothetical protein [Phenylobacterium sp.]
MSEGDPSAADHVEVDIRAWVEAASNNLALYRDRQVTEIVLTAIGLAPSLKETLVLKGGTACLIGSRATLTRPFLHMFTP